MNPSRKGILSVITCQFQPVSIPQPSLTVFGSYGVGVWSDNCFHYKWLYCTLRGLGSPQPPDTALLCSVISGVEAHVLQQIPAMCQGWTWEWLVSEGNKNIVYPFTVMIFTGPSCRYRRNPLFVTSPMSV